MDNIEHGINWIKISLAGITSLLLAHYRMQVLLGGVLAVLMLADWITGTRAAKRSGTWSSQAAREGFDHKIGALVVLIVAFMADLVFRGAAEMMPWEAPAWPFLWMSLVEVWYCFTEAGSILEKCVKMGVSVPKWCMAAISAGTAAMDKKGEEAASLIAEDKREREGIENG
jgi:toxin secretion/phage lysis holin